MKTEVFKDFGAFLDRPDKDVNGVDQDFINSNNPDYEKQNDTNKGCWNCRNCTFCIDCVNCQNCVKCDYCVSCKGCVSCSKGCKSCLDCIDCKQCLGCKGCKGCFNIVFARDVENVQGTAIPA